MFIPEPQCEIPMFWFLQISAKIEKGHVPLLLVLYDYWYIQRRLVNQDGISNGVRQPTAALAGQWKYLLPALCLSAASILKTFAIAIPRSTYICLTSSYGSTFTLSLQVLGIFLDCFVLMNFVKAVRLPAVNAATEGDIAPILVGSIFLVDTWTLSPDSKDT